METFFRIRHDHLFLSLHNYLSNNVYEDLDERKSDVAAFLESKSASF
jgi:hypothetical protein